MAMLRSSRELLSRLGFAVLAVAAARGQVGPPDKFVEAAVYADFASAAMRCQDLANPSDPVGQAKTWTQKAIAVVSTFRSSDPDEQARAAKFLNQEKIVLASLVKREEFLKKIQKRTQSALSAGRLETATKSVSEGSGPSCDPRMRRARELVEEQRRRYTEAVADADSSVSRPSEALEKYKAAAKYNHEDPICQEKLYQGNRK